MARLHGWLHASRTAGAEAVVHAVWLSKFCFFTYSEGRVCLLISPWARARSRRAAMPLGALRRAQLPLAWLCLLRLSHANRCASWCRWDLASSCFKHESCADCNCPVGSQEGCLAWCDGHCEDPKCVTCRACKEHRECDPVDRRDAKIEGCASWCSTSFSSEHCGKCSCKACDFCLALYPREDEEPEVEDGDAPSSAAAPIQMTDDLRRARWRWITAHLQERARCCGSCAGATRFGIPICWLGSATATSRSAMPEG